MAWGFFNAGKNADRRRLQANADAQRRRNGDYVSASGGKTLTFDHNPAVGQNTASLAATAVHLPSGVTMKDSAGNAAKLSLTSQRAPPLSSERSIPQRQFDDRGRIGRFVLGAPPQSTTARQLGGHGREWQATNSLQGASPVRGVSRSGCVRLGVVCGTARNEDRLPGD